MVRFAAGLPLPALLPAGFGGGRPARSARAACSLVTSPALSSSSRSDLAIDPSGIPRDRP